MIKNSVLQKIQEIGVVAVIRASSKESAYRIAEACYAGGIRAIEITFTVPGADEVIAELSKQARNNDMMVGAGSVIDEQMALKAIHAGAKFVVGPGFDMETAIICQKRQIPYIPGCLTVTEMLQAMKSGSEMIKLFPGSLPGPDYVKAIKGPLPNIHIMPTGGVSLSNVRDWIQSGVVAIGVGGEITAPAKNNDYDQVQERAKAFVMAVENARQEMSQ
jgi:2-dehydro-3-deoxyphosphogluconate aldolase/(4S)-4-hydroxy-2-oxoglutarate aldolase